MEVSIAAPRKLEGDKAQRIVAAMRASVAARGAAGSTFDQVAREAGVSRGLLHYYFGSKERLLVEVVRQDCDTRIRAMDERLAGAESVDEVIQALVVGLEEFIGEPRSCTGAGATTWRSPSATRSVRAW
jgi:AcrR family transcriptional regulator